MSSRHIYELPVLPSLRLYPENRLDKFVKSGKVEMEALVDSEKIAIIQELFQECGPISLSEAREILGEEYSYGDLRIVRNSITFEEQKEEPEKESE